MDDSDFGWTGNGWEWDEPPTLSDADDLFRMLSMLEREERPVKHRFPSDGEIAANYGLTPLRLRRMEKRVKVIYKDNPATIWLAGLVGFLAGVVLVVLLST